MIKLTLALVWKKNLGDFHVEIKVLFDKYSKKITLIVKKRGYILVQNLSIVSL